MTISKQFASAVARTRANLVSPVSLTTDGKIEAFALQWFEQMRAGQIDRTQLEARYNAHLKDSAVERMSRYLKAFDYGVSPLGAQVMRTHSADDQTFHLVKLMFPRGDAASLLFGFDSAGKITGISLLGMAGD